MRSLLLILAYILPLAGTLAAVEPTDEITLFEGPAPGEVKYKRHKDTELKTEAGTIQFVCRDAVYLRVKSGFVRTIDTKTYYISEATATANGKKLAWILDPAKNELKGSVEPIRTPILPESTVTPATEKLYLYFSLERLQERIDQAVQENDVEALKQYRERADNLRERAEKVGADFRLIDQFKKVAAYIVEQQRLTAEKEEYLDKHMEKVEMNRIVDQEAKLKSEMERMRAIAFWGDGSPRVSVTLTRRGTYVRVSSGGLAGVAMMSRAELMYEHDRLRIAHAKKLLDKEKAKALDEFTDRVTASRDARLKDLAALGHDLHGLPSVKDVLEQRSLASLLHQKEDYTQLNRVLNGRITSDKTLLQQVNPFAVLNAISIGAQIPEKTREQQAERLFALSQEMLEAVKYVPKDSLYDADRADIMRTAAGIAIMAAVQDSPDGSWRNAASSKAAFAVRLLNKAGELVIDKDGQIREQKSVAQALAGRFSDALRSADEIRKSREKVVPYLISYARLQSLNDKSKEGLDTIGDAIGLGYDDIGFISKNEDFVPLRRNEALFKAYTKPQFTVDWVMPKPLAKNANASRIEIINNSPFAITKLRVTLRLELRGQPDKPVIKTVDVARIDKTDKYIWESAFEEPTVRVYKIKITIDSDQGKYVTESPNRK